MLPTNDGKGLRDRRIRNVRAIPGYQEIHSVHGCDGDVRSVGSRFPGDYARGQDTRR
jgi:hypothetical protein